MAAVKLKKKIKKKIIRVVKKQVDSLFEEACTGIPGYDPCYGLSDRYYFDEEIAAEKIEFIETCIHHTKGEWAGRGELIKLEAWQRAIIANIFGWRLMTEAGYVYYKKEYRRLRGNITRDVWNNLRGMSTRRYRKVFLLVPRKNAKTTLAAAIVNVMLFTEGEAGAEIYSCAADKKQASLCFDIVKGMVLREEELAKRAKVYMKEIRVGDATYVPLSADAYTKHGANAYCVIFDEVHAYPNPDLVDVMITSMGARLDPLALYTTTSDFQRESICNEVQAYATAVQKREIKDDAFLPILYKANEDDDWTDEEVWKKANPNYGVSVGKVFLRDEFDRAKKIPRFLNSALRLYLNIQTRQNIRWINMEEWKEKGGCDVDAVTWREHAIEKLAGKRCIGALDLGATSDLTSLVLMFRVGMQRVVIPWFWVPEDTVVRKREEKLVNVDYTPWIEQGFIIETPGNCTDYRQVRKDIIDIFSIFDVEELAVDRLFQGQQLCTELAEEDGIKVIAFPQTFAAMTAPSEEFERLLLAGQLKHGDNPVLAWNAENVELIENAQGGIKPAKPKRKNGLKVDGIVAIIMAVARDMLKTEDGCGVGVSYYEEV